MARTDKSTGGTGPADEQGLPVEGTGPDALAEGPQGLDPGVAEIGSDDGPEAVPDFSPLDLEPAPRPHGRLDKGRERAVLLLDDLWSDAIRSEIASACDPNEYALHMSLGVLHGYGATQSRLAAALDALTYNPKADAGKFACRTVLVSEREASLAKETDTPAKLSEAVRALLRDGNAVILVASDSSLPAGLAPNVTWSHRVDDLRPRLTAVLSAMRAAGNPVDLKDGRPCEEACAALESPIPPDRARAVLAWLGTVAAKGRADPPDMANIGRIANHRLLSVPTIADGPRSLAEAKGVPPRVATRLKLLAERLRGPMQEPLGLLLEGPPGTGKTLLAGLLAAESGRHFVQASVTDWQGAGYLQDMISAMRRSFEEARRNAPSVLFLDELDSIGRRGTGDRNEQFWTLMINAFLEHLQGLGGRGDVAVVGATNNVAFIDPAVLRAGRFGEHIHIPNPDRAGRAAILASILPGTLAAQVDVTVLADRTGECSPALLRALATETSMLAGRRPPTPADLEEAMVTMGRRVAGGHDPARLRPLLAVGLCAKAVTAAAAYGDAVRIDAVSVLPGLADLGRVSLTHRSGAIPQETALDLTRLLHVQLAPAAGRLMAAAAFARKGDPGALGMFSHLTAGEDARAEATARLIVRSGATGRIYPTERDHETEAAVRATLAKGRREVTALVARAKSLVIDAAQALTERGTLDGRELSVLLGLPEPIPPRTLH